MMEPHSQTNASSSSHTTSLVPTTYKLGQQPKHTSVPGSSSHHHLRGFSLFDMRRLHICCSHYGNRPECTTTWLHHCLSYTALLTSFLVDTIAALDLGRHRWPSWLITTTIHSETSAACFNHMAASTVAFFTASTIIYQISVGDQCQDHFLLAGITSGIAVGFLLSGGLHTVIFNVMPWTVMSALLCSIIYHRIARLAPCRATVVEEKAPLLE